MRPDSWSLFWGYFSSTSPNCYFECMAVPDSRFSNTNICRGSRNWYLTSEASQRCMYHRSVQIPSCDSSTSKLISQLTLSCVQVHLMNRNSIIGLQIPTLSTRIKVLNMPRKNRRLSTYLSDSVARKHIVCTIRLPSQRRRR